MGKGGSDWYSHINTGTQHVQVRFLYITGYRGLWFFIFLKQ